MMEDGENEEDAGLQLLGKEKGQVQSRRRREEEEEENLA
jgi:hypothetical protein